MTIPSGPLPTLPRPAMPMKGHLPSADARQRMLEEQLRARGIADTRVLAAMARVARERFMPDEARPFAYGDHAAMIGCGQTISQPFMVALMSEALELTGTEHVLEVGTGSGYQTAILAELARDVVSIERHAELSHEAGEVLSDLGYRNVTLKIGDGSQGYAELAPYNRVLVTAAASRVPPALFDQLVEGGILVIPVGGEDSQMLQVIHKRDGRPLTRELTACRFVPLIGQQAGRG